MPSFINHAAVAAPRNGTTSHTVAADGTGGTVVAGTAFTPTAGNLLIVVVEGPVTSTTPTGWTLPTGGSAVNNTGLYVWYRTAAGGGDSLSTTHNGSNEPVVFDFYEFASGSTFGSAASATGVSRSGGAGPSLSGQTGTHTFMAAVGGDITVTTGTNSTTWASGTEAVDTFTVKSGTDGYAYSLAYMDGSTAATFSDAATLNLTVTTVERLVFSLVVATGGGGTAWTADGAISDTDTISAVASLATSGTASVGETATVSADSLVDHPATGTLTGTDTVTATASRGQSTSATTLAATSAVAAAAILGAVATAGITATAAIAADAQVGHSAAATLAASDTITATAATSTPGSSTASIIVTDTVAAGASLGAVETGSISTADSIQAVALIEHPAVASLAVMATVSAAATVTHGAGADATLTSTDTIIATAARTATAAASLTGSVVLTGSLRAAYVVGSSLAATATLAATAEVQSASGPPTVLVPRAQILGDPVASLVAAAYRAEILGDPQAHLVSD